MPPDVGEEEVHQGVMYHVQGVGKMTEDVTDPCHTVAYTLDIGACEQDDGKNDHQTQTVVDCIALRVTLASDIGDGKAANEDKRGCDDGRKRECKMMQPLIASQQHAE